MSPQSRGRPALRVARTRPPHHWIAAWLIVIVVTVALVLTAEYTGHGRSIVTLVAQFLLVYTGVFALVGLTAVIGIGLLATDRVIMRPEGRVVAQAAHRGMTLAALAALAAHITVEILARRARAADAVVPFVAQRRTLYMGLGTLAWDLVVLIAVTGFLRSRFALTSPGAWRIVHVIAYLAWPLAIVHGLMAGRAARPYVNWSYGACLAAVAIVLTIRFAATLRSNEKTEASAVPHRLSLPVTEMRATPQGAHPGASGP